MKTRRHHKRKREATIGILILLIAGAFFLTQGSNPTTDGSTNFVVDCPEEVTPECQQLSNNYSANATLLYTSSYRKGDGGAYFVELSSNQQIKSYGTTAVARIDNQSNEFVGLHDK